MTTEKRYCEDCRWFRWANDAWCDHANSTVDVYGEDHLIFRPGSRTEQSSCYEMRHDELDKTSCGPEGKLWEPR